MVFAFLRMHTIIILYAPTFTMLLLSVWIMGIMAQVSRTHVPHSQHIKTSPLNPVSLYIRCPTWPVLDGTKSRPGAHSLRFDCPYTTKQPGILPSARGGGTRFERKKFVQSARDFTGRGDGEISCHNGLTQSGTTSLGLGG